MSKIAIPLACPSCGGKMYATAYDVFLNILKERCWQVCNECGFERSTEDFKKELLTV